MSRILWNLILIIILFISCGYCREAAFSFNESGQYPLMNGNVTEYNGSDIVTSAIASASLDAESTSSESKTVDDIKKEINFKLNIGNDAVKDEGRSLTLEYPGDRSIKQICSIYDNMVSNWHYIPDTRGIEDFQYSNKSLEYGKGKYSGQGDCDDFSILLASLIESIGCTSRIMLAYGPMGGHAYTEVYLGKAEGVESDADRMIKWLRTNYKVSDINVHTDLDTGEVWLNLDWWRDPNALNDLAKHHPGGPFFKATNQTPIPIRENIAKVPLRPLNDLPIVMFTVSPAKPNANDTVTFNASPSRDIGKDGDIKRYLWNYGDNQTGEGKITSHVYLQGGIYLANLTVVDNDWDENYTVLSVAVNALPVPIVEYSPKDPKVGDDVVFDASRSWDKEDGKASQWHWEFSDGESSTNEITKPHKFDEADTYEINLTVFDKNHAVSTISMNLKINSPPKAEFSYSTKGIGQYPNENDAIEFESKSEDKDGNITSYLWTFGDESPSDEKASTNHTYKKCGPYQVSLRVADDNNATAFENKTITVNCLPVASISPLQPSHGVGESIVFNASGSSDNESANLEYSWDFNNDGIIDSKLKRDAYDYRLSGLYVARLTVTDENKASNSTEVNLSIREKNTKPLLESFAPNLPSPQKAGTTITWTVQAKDADGDSMLYQFLVDGKIVKDWTSQSSWPWNTEGINPESHKVEARIRDGNNAGPDSYDALASEDFSIEKLASDSNYWGHYQTKEDSTELFLGHLDGYLYEASKNKALLDCGHRILKNDKSESIDLKEGSSLILSNGYELNLASFDEDGSKAYLELSKNGGVIDAKVISPTKNGATDADKTYLYKMKSQGDDDNLIIIAVHFSDAYRNSNGEDSATIDAIWQISEEATCSSARSTAEVSYTGVESNLSIGTMYIPILIGPNGEKISTSR
jgi:PKD repeat protein